MDALDNFGPIKPNEILEATHPLEWRTANKIFETISDLRGRFSWTTKNAFPGTSLLLYVELPTRRSLKYYDMPDQGLPPGMQIAGFDNHFEALLKSAVAHKLLTLKRASLLAEESHVEPKVMPDDPILPEHGEQIRFLWSMHNAPEDITRQDLRDINHSGTPIEINHDSTEEQVRSAIIKTIHSIEEYGIGMPYYQLTKKGLGCRKPAKSTNKTTAARFLEQF